MVSQIKYRFGMRLFLILAIALFFISCSEENSTSPITDPGGEQILVPGSNEESWTEVPLAASDLPPVQIHIDTSRLSWNFANVLRNSESWILSDNSLSSETAASMAKQLSIRSDGWPASLPDGYYMTLNRSGYPTGAGPATDADGVELTTYLHGVWVLTWEGSGSVDFQTSQNDGTGETELLDDSANGRIVVLITDPYKYPIIRVSSTDVNDPIRNMKLWAPVSDGAGLTLTESSELSPGEVEGSLEPLPGTEEPMFHPAYIDHLAEAGSGIPLRIANFLKINQETEVWDSVLNWSDAGNQSYSFGSLSICDSDWNRYNVEGYKQKLGAPYEWTIDLCNKTNNDIWIQLPHVASEDLIRNLARLIAGEGESGHEGLNENLRVWFEFSNELWNGIGVYLPQNLHAKIIAANEFGVAIEELTTAQSGWGAGHLQGLALSVFESEWSKCGGTDDRLINVVAGFSEGSSYNRAQIEAVKEIDPNLAETLAISNYFGHSATPEIYSFHDWENSDGETWPDSLLIQTKASLQRNLYNTYESWSANYRIAQEEGAHLISYEGGQHITPSGLGDSSDPAFKNFMNYLSYIQTNDLMKDLYTEHYALWSTAGGRTVSLYSDIGPHSYWGYWGSKEWLLEGRDSSKKWDAFLLWIDTIEGVRALNDPVSTSPVLDNKVIKAEAGTSFSETINTNGGEGPIAISIIGGELPEGIIFTDEGDGTATISGTPVVSSTAKIIVRAVDSDKDPAYNIYTISIDPEGMGTNAILSFVGADIPKTEQANGDINGRYDPQRDYELHGTDDSILCIPFMTSDGTALFGEEYDDSEITGENTIPMSSQLNMYGGWAVTQLEDSEVSNCQSSYTVLRDDKFISWSGANCDGYGPATTLDVFLLWRKDQFTSNTEASVYSFGESPETSTLRVDFTDLIPDGYDGENTNELRFAVLNGETWYLSEIAYTNNYVGDGFLELSDFNNSSNVGDRWAVITPGQYSFAIPASLTFEAKNFDNIQAVGLVYHGLQNGYHYNFGFNRFIVLGEQN